MLKIRLQRVGRAHEPSFRLVLTDSKNSTKSGRFGEVLGSYDPRKLTESFNAERIQHWLSKGIGLTPSVNNLLIKHGIIRGKKIHVSTVPLPAPVVSEESAPEIKEEAPVVEPAPESAPAEDAPAEVVETPQEVPAEAPSEEPAPKEPTPEV